MEFADCTIDGKKGVFMLSFEDFSLSYGESAPVLQDITLSMKEGECLLLTGESGSGKSSLIHAVNGLAYQYYNGKSTGKVLFQGKDLSSLPIYKIELPPFFKIRKPIFSTSTPQENCFLLWKIWD